MRLIDADALIHKYIDTDIEKFSNSDVKIVLENLKQNILKAPTIDIVRCKECKHRTYCYSEVHMTNKRQSVNMHKDIDFCSYGERREP